MAPRRSGGMAAIAVATDCSGMEAPIQALQNLGIPYRHVFSCDVDRHARATIEANFPPEVMYEDVRARNNAEALASDIYFAGFPCQPFSTGGLKEGFKDRHNRGEIFFFVRDYIAQQRPKAFVLENVSGLKTTNKGEYFRAILRSLEDLGDYNLYFELLDTVDHGVPCNRKRCYIVGIHTEADLGSFAFPGRIPCPSIDDFLDPPPAPEAVADALPPPSQTTACRNVAIALTKIAKAGGNPLLNSWVVDCDASTERLQWKRGVSPCMTCSRKRGHWVTNRGRRINKPEMFRLHGMNPANFKVVVSEPQLGMQLGNAMSVNVLERLLVRLLPAAGLVDVELPDRWQDGSAVAALMATRGLCFPDIPAAGARRLADSEDGDESDDWVPTKRRRRSSDVAPTRARRLRASVVSAASRGTVA